MHLYLFICLHIAAETVFTCKWSMLVKDIELAGAGLLVEKRTPHTTLQQMQSVRVVLQALPMPIRALYVHKDLEILEI